MAPTDVPVTPRDAATVALLRDGDAGLEVFLLRRRASMSFAAGMSVFPGGAVDQEDGEIPLSGNDSGRSATLLRASTEVAHALIVAAVRETFEECGVLLARGRAGELVAPVDAADAALWEVERGRVSERGASGRFAALLQAHGWFLDASLVIPFDHWITPESEPRRFDTRFLLAAMPAGQVAIDPGAESDQGHWWRPAAALEAAHAGDMMILRPTQAALEWLAGYPDVGSALAAATTREFVPKLPGLAADRSGMSIFHADTGEMLDAFVPSGLAESDGRPEIP